MNCTTKPKIDLTQPNQFCVYNKKRKGDKTPKRRLAKDKSKMANISNANGAITVTAPTEEIATKFAKKITEVAMEWNYFVDIETRGISLVCRKGKMDKFLYSSL